jgi:glycosyltransferase involved in cell wall biosynthesis
MTSTPLVTAIIATYNRAYIVGEAIESVLQQTYSHLELIVIDDGSTDETQETLKAYGDRIRVIRQPNAGPAAARNTGIRASRGTYISFVDSDDVWRPSFIEKGVELLETCEFEIGGVFCDLELISNGRFVPSMLQTYPKFWQVFGSLCKDGHEVNDGKEVLFPQQLIYTCLLEEMPVKLQAVTLRASAVHKVGRFLDSWRSGEDWEYFLRFARHYGFAYVNSPLVTQRIQSDSTLARYKTVDAQNLMGRFIKEKKSLTRPDDFCAVRRSIAYHANELGWQYGEQGHPGKSCWTYMRGFLESGELRLFTRSAAALLPPILRRTLKKFRKGMA